MNSNMVISAFERRGGIAADVEINASLQQLQSHMTTQLMKAVATLTVSNAPRGQEARLDRPMTI